MKSRRFEDRLYRFAVLLVIITCGAVGGWMLFTGHLFLWVSETKATGFALVVAGGLLAGAKDIAK